LQALKKSYRKKGVDYNVDYRHLHKSNEFRWQNFYRYSNLDDNGNPTQMIGSIRDINKTTEEEL
jgi:PAS domain-containing protein